MVPIILQLAQDKSWRVRYMAADQYKELCDAVGDEAAKQDKVDAASGCSSLSFSLPCNLLLLHLLQVVDAFVRLLEDGEAEVRTAAVLKLGEVRTRASASQQHIAAVMSQHLDCLCLCRWLPKLDPSTR